MEVIDIVLNDLEPIELKFDDMPSSNSGVNFGSGIELLMNDKKKSASASTNVDLGDLDKLESELNELSSSASEHYSKPDSSTKTMSGLSGFGSTFSNFFGGSSETKNTVVSENTDSNLGQATSESIGNTKTWDGFTKLGEVPAPSINIPLTDRERRRKKRAMLQKLQDWYDKGHIKHNSHYSMESSYEEIEDEYETALEDKRKRESVKLQQWWFMTFVNSVEYANSAFNPFDINLDGWGEQVSEDIDSYEEIFTELHDKYKGGKLAPELSLLLRLGFSAAVVNFSNKALSSATPAFNDVIKQSPELMRMFTNATVNSMSQQSPGFAFANNLVNEQGPPRNMGPPPAPQDPKMVPPPPRPGQTPNLSQMQFQERPVRPDIAMARGSMFREQGVDVNQPYDTINPPQRQEMRGPQNTDIDTILSGLKTRTVDIHSNQTQPSYADDSVVSITSLKDMQDSAIPKKSRRKNNSRTTISLDI
jgi:hypothetical protein